MGDRALVLFKDKASVSPTVYLHWNGHMVGRLLAAAAPRMRSGEADYACARFIGTCHEAIEGGLSLGVFNTDAGGEPESQGDAGVFVVDVNTGEVSAYGGYGFGDNPPELPLQLGRF